MEGRRFVFTSASYPIEKLGNKCEMVSVGEDAGRDRGGGRQVHDSLPGDGV